MAYAVTKALGSGAPGSLVALLAGGSVQIGVFMAAAHLMRLPEVRAMVGIVRGRLGR